MGVFVFEMRVSLLGEERLTRERSEVKKVFLDFEGVSVRLSESKVVVEVELNKRREEVEEEKLGRGGERGGRGMRERRFGGDWKSALAERE